MPKNGECAYDVNITTAYRKWTIQPRELCHSLSVAFFSFLPILYSLAFGALPPPPSSKCCVLLFRHLVFIVSAKLVTLKLVRDQILLNMTEVLTFVLNWRLTVNNGRNRIKLTFYCKS